jgi:nucleotide-binding universal stress UspA family protein
MLKGLLLALDRTTGALEGKKLAFALARTHDAVVQGILVVEPDVVAPPEPVPIGGGPYKEHRDATMIGRAKAEATLFAQQFVEECRASKVNGDACVIVDDAVPAIVGASARHDAVLLGVDSDFSGDAAPLSPLIVELLRNNPRPLIVSPKQAAANGKTVVAYDGSIPAMRALQLFCAMELRADSEAIVVTVDPDASKAAETASVAVDYLRARGYRASPMPVAVGTDVSAAIAAAAQGAGMVVVVAGAYGHRGWREWLLGTTTERLLMTSPTHVFIHH